MSTKVGTLEIEMAANIARLTEDFAKARAEVNKSTSEMQRSVDKMRGEIESQMKKVGDAVQLAGRAFVAVGAIVAGGKLFGAAVDESVKLTKGANELGKTFGITATEASVLNVALGDIYQSGETAQAANKALTKQLVNNEGAFKSLGVATRDQNGNYRSSLDIMLDVNKRLLDFKEGTDRNVEGMKVYGKAWGEVQGMLKLNKDLMEDSRKKAEELGLIVGKENVEAVDRYRAAMNDVGDVISAVKKSIGDALIPILTELGNWFAGYGKEAVIGMKIAIGALASAFYGLKMLVQIVLESVELQIQTAVIAIVSFVSAVEKALMFDFTGAKAEWEKGTSAIVENFDKAMDRIVQKAEINRDKIFGILADEHTPTTKKTGGKTSDGKEAPDKKEPKAKSRTSEFEAELNALKLAHDKENEANHTFYEFSKEKERAFWQAILERHDLSKEERIAIERKYLNAAMAISEEHRKIALAQIDAQRNEQIGALELEREKIALRKDLGQISAIEELQALRELKDKEFQIEIAAEQDKQKLDTNSELNKQQHLEKLAQIQRKHDADMAKENNKILVEQKKEFDKMFAPLTSAFEKSVSGIIGGTLTIQKAMRQMAQSVVLEFANMGAKVVAQWAATELFKTQATIAGAATRTGVETTAAATSTSISAGAAIKDIMMSAWETMASVYKSIAAIPYVGPFMAPAAAAGAFGVVAGFASNIASSAGGDWMIPSDRMNIVHAQETILPADKSRGLDNLIQQGTQGGGDTIHVHAMDAKSFSRFLVDNRSALPPALQKLSRQFVKV